MVARPIPDPARGAGVRGPGGRVRVHETEVEVMKKKQKKEIVYHKVSQFKNSAVGIDIVLMWKQAEIKVPCQYSGNYLNTLLFHIGGNHTENDYYPGLVCKYEKFMLMVFPANGVYSFVVSEKGCDRPVAYFDYLITEDRACNKALEFIRDLNFPIED